MIRKHKQLLLLIGIFLLALMLRTYSLSSIPVGFHIDEASLGYNGYSLLLTGKDDNGNPWPLYIDMFGDNRPSGYHYLTILPIVLFGLTEFATRLPAAVFGAISVFAIYFLTLTLFKKQSISLLASLLLAIAPWHIVLSRASGEAVVALFFILTGFAFLIKYMQTRITVFLVLSVLLVSCSFFFYHTPRVFVPLLFLGILFFYWRQWIFDKSNKYKTSLIIGFLSISIIAAVLVLLVSGGTGRFTQVNIFSFPETALVMQEQIREDGVAGNSVFLTRIFHNKIVNYTFTFLGNYFEYFTGKFLFIQGGLPIWYAVPSMGLLLIVLLPFIIIGTFFLVLSKQQFAKLPLLWLVLAPVVASITVDDIPNINRAIVLFPMLEMIAAYGFISILLARKQHVRTVIVGIFAIILLMNFFYFLHQYTVHSKLHRTWYRNNGVKEMIVTIQKSYNSVDQIVMTNSAGGIYPLILFYMKYDPAVYQQEGSPKNQEYVGFGKFFFVPHGCPTLDKDDRFPKTKNAIFVNMGDCKEHPQKPYKDIYREDGTRAFRIQYD